jgi:NAD+ kinase
MTFGIIANTSFARIWQVLPEFLGWLASKGISTVVSEDLKEGLGAGTYKYLPHGDLAAASDMVLSFGGDGTLLSTARKIGRSQTPILGVNLGGLGYLAEISFDSLYPRFEELLSGSYRVEDRMVLYCQVEGSDSKYHALNDVVIDKGAYSRVVRLQVSIGGRFLNSYTGDGVIVATPTGSTAYSLSAGGPILEPTLNSIIVNPISPHTLTDRPIIIGDDRVIEATVTGKHRALNLVIDGQVERTLEPGNRVIIKRADYVVKLVIFTDKYFYDVLREKLKWGGMPSN